MNRQWMYVDRRSPEFMIGVQDFIRVAEANKRDSFMYCPCSACKNIKGYSKSKTIHIQLFESGFMSGYRCWTKHGETGVIMEDNEEDEDPDNYPEFPEYDGTTMGGPGVDAPDEEAPDEPADDLARAIADAQRNNINQREWLKLERMLEDHKKKLYPGVEDDQKKLGTTLDLLQWKAENGVSDKGFEKLLKKIKKMLPKDNELPDSTYEAKKIICPLGLEVQKIHACINDCILYRGERYENMNACPVCGALRYKIR